MSAETTAVRPCALVFGPYRLLRGQRAYSGAKGSNGSRNMNINNWGSLCSSTTRVCGSQAPRCSYARGAGLFAFLTQDGGLHDMCTPCRCLVERCD